MPSSPLPTRYSIPSPAFLATYAPPPIVAVAIGCFIGALAIPLITFPVPLAITSPPFLATVPATEAAAPLFAIIFAPCLIAQGPAIHTPATINGKNCTNSSSLLASFAFVISYIFILSVPSILVL